MVMFNRGVGEVDWLVKGGGGKIDERVAAALRGFPRCAELVCDCWPCYLMPRFSNACSEVALWSVQGMALLWLARLLSNWAGALMGSCEAVVAKS